MDAAFEILEKQKDLTIDAFVTGVDKLLEGEIPEFFDLDLRRFKQTHDNCMDVEEQLKYTTKYLAASQLYEYLCAKQVVEKHEHSTQLYVDILQK